MSKNNLWKVNEAVSKSKIILRENTGNAGRKTWKPGQPGEFYRNWETHSCIGRVALGCILEYIKRCNLIFIDAQPYCNVFYVESIFLAQTLILCYPLDNLELSSVDGLKSFIFIRTCTYVINVPLFQFANCVRKDTNNFFLAKSSCTILTWLLVFLFVYSLGIIYIDTCDLALCLEVNSELFLSQHGTAKWRTVGYPAPRLWYPYHWCC